MNSNKPFKDGGHEINNCYQPTNTIQGKDISFTHTQIYRYIDI